MLFARTITQIALLICSAAITVGAQTLTPLCGLYPVQDVGAPLIQGTDGNLYGTAFAIPGTIFKVSLDGTLTTIYTFCSEAGCADGDGPYAALVQGTGGDFYGVTSAGGTNLYGGSDRGGTIFKVTASGDLTTLYSFCSKAGCADGSSPSVGLIQGANGLFYGVTFFGGANDTLAGPYGPGTIFEVTANGRFKTLYSFCAKADCADGYYPEGGLLQAANGDLYGTTGAGGAYGQGTVFKITPTGTLTTLHSFCAKTNCVDGAGPSGALVRGSDGAFYGTTAYGGLNSPDCVSNGCGTLFRVTGTGSFTTVYSFCSEANCADGALPNRNLVAATDGAFYGTTAYGGTFSAGAIFKVTSPGGEETLFSFCYAGSSCTGVGAAVGAYPDAGLVQDTNGDLYGTTVEGGESGLGAVFSLSAGLHPFVETQPASGKAGATVKILGNNLGAATSVTFNGTNAVFKVVSSSLITATVPAGAISGKVEVITPGGTLSSNVPFLVQQ